MIGVLVMAYGTPADRDDIARYYTDIRRGDPPPAHLLAELTARYDAIGGTFPLRRITEAQAAALAVALADREPGRFEVAIGAKHSPPFVEDGVAKLLAGGAEAVVGLVLAPHYSRFSVGQYAERAAAAGAGVPVSTIESWHLLPAYLSFLSVAVQEAVGSLPAGVEVVFTAHSLPQRITETGDPYPDQLGETARAVAELASLTNWSVGWQSAGRTPDPWLGPDVLEILRDRAAAGAAGVVVCPCGFVADHLEVAYDLDVEAARAAAELGLPFARTRTLGADAEVIGALADLVVERSRSLVGR